MVAIDLGALLLGPGSSAVTPGGRTRIIVVRADGEDNRELIAWPILDGSRVECEALAPQAASPEGFPQDVLRASIWINEQELHLLDTRALINLALSQSSQQNPVYPANMNLPSG